MPADCQRADAKPRLFTSPQPLVAGESVGYELPCPAGSRAIGGNFASESPLVVLSSVYPGEAPDSWVVFATNLGDADTTWQAGVTCV
jgi:hypothetical protein